MKKREYSDWYEKWKKPNKADPKEVGKYLKSIREDRNLTLSELGKLMGYTNPYLSQIENGKKGVPSLELLFKFADAFNIQPYILFNKAGYMSDRDLETIMTAERHARMAASAETANEKSIKNITVPVINPEKFPHPRTLKKTINVPSQYKIGEEIKDFENSDLLDLYYLIHLAIDNNDNINLTFKNKPIDKEKLPKVLEAIRLYLD